MPAKGSMDLLNAFFKTGFRLFVWRSIDLHTVKAPVLNGNLFLHSVLLSMRLCALQAASHRIASGMEIRLAPPLLVGGWRILTEKRFYGRIKLPEELPAQETMQAGRNLCSFRRLFQRLIPPRSTML